MLAYKDLEESYYKDWSERLHRAGSAPEAREDHLAQLYDEVEHDMMVGGLKAEAGGGWGQPLLISHLFGSPKLLGATAIEDKLQQGVPETIAILTLANIKIWVLTGDKQGEAWLRCWLEMKMFVGWIPPAWDPYCSFLNGLWLSPCFLYSETAVNIGYSCKMLTDDMTEVFVVTGHTVLEVREELR